MKPVLSGRWTVWLKKKGWLQEVLRKLSTELDERLDVKDEGEGRV